MSLHAPSLHHKIAPQRAQPLENLTAYPIEKGCPGHPTLGQKYSARNQTVYLWLKASHLLRQHPKSIPGPVQRDGARAHVAPGLRRRARGGRPDPRQPGKRLEADLNGGGPRPCALRPRPVRDGRCGAPLGVASGLRGPRRQGRPDWTSPPGGQRRQLRLQLDHQRQLPAAGRLRCGVPRCEPVLDVVRFLIGASPGQRRRLPVQLDPQRQLQAARQLRCGVPRREPVGSVYEVSEPLIALNC